MGGVIFNEGTWVLCFRLCDLNLLEIIPLTSGPSVVSLLSSLMR